MLGLAPMLAHEGDCVCILQGARVPFVLRRTKEQGRFLLVGEAYIDGFMRGEVEKLSLPVEEVCLI